MRFKDGLTVCYRILIVVGASRCMYYFLVMLELNKLLGASEERNRIRRCL